VVEVCAKRRGGVVDVVISDDGAGLPPGFSVASSPRLGLQIVRTLVEGDLRGEIQLVAGETVGTRAILRIPISPDEEAPNRPVSLGP
jgi:two-component sensor histidine kinase